MGDLLEAVAGSALYGAREALGNLAADERAGSWAAVLSALGYAIDGKERYPEALAELECWRPTLPPAALAAELKGIGLCIWALVDSFVADLDREVMYALTGLLIDAAKPSALACEGMSLLNRARIALGVRG